MAGATLALAALGARRIDVTWFGKAGTFCLMFAFPLFLASESTVGWADTAETLAWIDRHPRPGPVVVRRRPLRAARPGRRSPRAEPITAPRRLTQGYGPRHEGRDHGRRRGHPAAPAHLQRSQADDAARQRADDGAHRAAAEAARLRRDRRHRRLHGQQHPHLLRRRLRLRRADGRTPPRRRRSARPARCATPSTSSTSASS